MVPIPEKQKRSVWSGDDERTFVQLWSDNAEELRGKRKNTIVYGEMSAQLLKMGILIPPNKVKIKISNLTRKYRKFKTDMGTSGGSPAPWPLYDEVHRIIGGSVKNTPDLVDEESIGESHSNDECMMSPGSSCTSMSLGSSLCELFELNCNNMDRAMEQHIAIFEKIAKIEKEKLVAIQDIRDDTRRLTDGVLKFLEIPANHFQQ